MSQRKDFLSNHLAQVIVPPHQQGRHGMRDEVLSSVVAQEMETKGYHLSGLVDVEFHWQKDQLDVHAVFRPALIPTFHLQPLTTGRREVQQRTHSVRQRGDKENPPPTTPVSETPTRPPALLRSRPIGTVMEIFPDFVCRKLFE